MTVLLPYMNFTDHEAFNCILSCTILSTAVLITSLISICRLRWLSRARVSDLTPPATPTTTPAATQCFFRTWRHRMVSVEMVLNYLRFKSRVSPIIPSPEKTLLPNLSQNEQASLAYHPDSLPGGRWLQTPTGRLRVYEFGPEDGKRVLFVHGISTPSIVARDLLLNLAARGCRVMVFDLPGRGYSECCRVTPQDMRLYSALIVMVTTSSTAAGGFLPFNIIGYSLGGGITVSFASQFPHLVSSIAVVSSAGLLPYAFAPLGMKCSLIPWIPVWLADKLLTTKLKGEEESPGDLSLDETANTTTPTQSVNVGPVDVFSVIRWQNRHQKGFMSGYVSSMRNGPIFDRVEEWTEVGRLLKGNRFANPRWDEKKPAQMLVVYGEKDDLTPPMLLDRIRGCVGDEHVKGVVVEGGGHEIVVYQWDRVFQEVIDFWEL
ncbi:hypothetical protein TWF191_003016 [Orbilia oligospora]|uniref:AB hydrolase-1 domain-containing protein n=2 Tax=Orbilia oligospora TaxID=2813651 RepID=A0A7C8V9D4_ORBOL|nr:hypothetical protein TWF679_001536 [Orbilia oligospora]KAF3228078.1 hypothetical protein TWF191_003016 [Orbilia oligospora]